MANPSIYLIDKGCMLHESGYNVHCKSFMVYGECPCTVSHAALSTVSIKAQDYGHCKINNKTKDQQNLYEKGTGGESRDKPSTPYRC